MAGLFITRTSDPAQADAIVAGARAQFRAHGFAEGDAIDLPGWRVLHSGYILGGPETLYRSGDDLVAVAGTLTVDGRIGRAALGRLLAAGDPTRLDWSRIGGQFVALVRKDGRSFVFTDYFAAFQLFRAADDRILSTSLLAAAKALPAVRFDPQGVYEYAFNVIPVGDDTVFAGIKLLGPRRIIELTPDGTISHAVERPLPRHITRAPLPERIARHRAALAAVVEAHAGGFGDRIHCPLSGGIDSRLVLAALRAAGSRPAVYVYGPAGSEDVEIARAIGRAEGFAVEWIDKAERPLAPDAFAAQVERNFHELDGLPNYGNIFDNGGNAAARDARHAGGALAASGGCGEIYRNFFFLPDRPISARAIAATFFGRFDRRDTTSAFEPRAFLDAIAGKIAEAVGADRGGRLPRALVEHVYPTIRCRSLFGREISLEARYGAYMMPFLDHRVVAEAMTLPMPLKNAGVFEARLLAEIDPVLARQPSAYGHDFAGPPSRRHRFDEWSSRVRPAWMRQRSYALRRRLKPMSDEHGGLLSPDYMGRVIDLEFPAMRRFFTMANVSDSGLWRRIACLEYLAGQLGGRLAD